MKDERNKVGVCVCMFTHPCSIFIPVYEFRGDGICSCMNYLYVGMYIAWTVRKLCWWRWRSCSSQKTLINKKETLGCRFVLCTMGVLDLQRIMSDPCLEKRGIVATRPTCWRPLHSNEKLINHVSIKATSQELWGGVGRWMLGKIAGLFQSSSKGKLDKDKK